MMRLVIYLVVFLVLAFVGDFAWKILHFTYLSTYSGSYAGKRPQAETRRDWIAYSNLAANYPFLGAVVPGVQQSKLTRATAKFIDLRDGSRHEISLAGIKYNAIAAIPGRAGAFLMTAHRGEARFVVGYDAIASKLDILFETDKEIRNPFLLGEVACAFYPIARTTKQATNFKPICDGTLIPDMTIDTIDATAYTESNAAFLDRKYADPNLYVLEQKTASWIQTDVPLQFVTGLFAYRDQIYVAGRNGGETIQLYRLENGRLEPVVGNLLDRLRLIDAKSATLHYIGQDHAVTARLDGDLHAIEIEVFDIGTTESRLHRLPLND